MTAGRRALIALAGGVAAWWSEAMAQTADRASLLKTLMDLEMASWRDVKDKSVAGMQSYMADDGLLIFADGGRFTKAEFLQLMPDYTLDSFAIEPGADIRIWAPDVAAILYRVTYASSVKGGKTTTLTVLSASTFVRRDGKWLGVLYQETPAP